MAVCSFYFDFLPPFQSTLAASGALDLYEYWLFPSRPANKAPGKHMDILVTPVLLYSRRNLAYYSLKGINHTG
jgi:hypothetical protein